MFKKNKDQSKQSSAVIPAVLISAFFGLAAGIVGMLVMLAYSSYIIPQTSYSSGNFVAPLIQQQDDRSSVDFTIKDIVASSALIFRAEDIGEITLTTKAIASGTVLTTDGWILSHEFLLTETGRTSGKGLVAVINGSAYEIKEAVVDSYTKVAFLKADGANLPVASFGQSSGLTVGKVVFAFDSSRGLREATIIDIGGLPAVDVASAVRSSEEIQKVIRLAGADDFMSGTALLNNLGEVVGLYVGDAAVGTYAIPIDSFFKQIGNVLRDRQVSRPYLGIRFVDLSEYPNDEGLVRGARLRANVSWPAVLRNSPAAAAGLIEGDIIKAINEEQITSNKSLPDLLTDYDSGETVTMTILRAGKETSVDVTLEQTL